MFLHRQVEGDGGQQVRVDGGLAQGGRGHLDSSWFLGERIHGKAISFKYRASCLMAGLEIGPTVIPEVNFRILLKFPPPVNSFVPCPSPHVRFSPCFPQLNALGVFDSFHRELVREFDLRQEDLWRL